MSWFGDEQDALVQLGKAAPEGANKFTTLAVTMALASLLALLWMWKGGLAGDKRVDTGDERASDLDFSAVKARRKTTMKPGGGNDMATIGTPTWVEARWAMHMEAAKAGESGSKMKKLDLAKVCEEVNALAASEKALQAGSLLLRLECKVHQKDTDKISGLIPSYVQIKLRYCFAKEFKSRIEDEEGYTLSR